MEPESVNCGAYCLLQGTFYINQPISRTSSIWRSLRRIRPSSEMGLYSQGFILFKIELYRHSVAV